MKKYALIAALVFLMGCLSACMPNKDTPSHTTPAETTSQPQQTTAPDVSHGPGVPTTTPPAQTLSEIPLSSLATPVVTEVFYADDGTALLNYTYQNAFLIYPDAAVADALYLSLLNATDYSSGLQETLSQAREDYTDDLQSWKPYSFRVLYDTMRIDQSVISIYGQVSTETSEASSTPMSASFSLINGRQLTFGDIQAPGYHYYTLLTKIDTLLRASDSAQALFEDYQDTLAAQLRSADTANWYFTETGLCFYYAPMEIASKSQGVITVEIPYSELQGLLADDYFPAEEYVTQGSVSAALFADAPLFQYRQFAEVIQDNQGVELLLSTDGAVTDVRIELGAWDATGTKFEPTATVFACDGISADTAIVVQCDLPDVMPVLRLHYTSQGTAYSRYITQSGKDGSILLTEN
ncbi:MAG: DUF3298 domain-containing protein [Oscillospiraceae bacterium]|nr:DUF3298 domain-containing protein [Oscillospiraceae bacterium]